jgi:tripartite-type tricarboxylate transporter receptor subunit TctC
LQEYIALAREKPGELFYASSGVGGPNHLAGEIFNRMAGIKITHVPYAGTGLALQAVLSNQVGAMWGFTAGLAAHIRQGTLRALAVGSKKRSPALPDVPTVAEAGVPGYEAVSWVGMVAPAEAPGTSIDKLWVALSAAMHEPSVRDIIVSGGSEVVCSTPDEFRQVLVSDYAKYGKLSDLFQPAK